MKFEYFRKAGDNESRAERLQEWKWTLLISL